LSSPERPTPMAVDEADSGGAGPAAEQRPSSLPAGQTRTQVVHHPRLLRLRAQGGRSLEKPHSGIRLQNRIGRIHDPPSLSPSCARQEVQPSSASSCPAMCCRDGMDNAPVAVIKNTAAVMDFRARATSRSRSPIRGQFHLFRSEVPRQAVRK